MSYFSYHHRRMRSRSRERTPQPLLVRHSSFKHQHLFSSSDDDDDDYDDYPYSGNHRPSRALTRREQPSQLERWNIWSDARKEERYDSPTEDDNRGRRRRRINFADEFDEDEERAFRLRIAALSRDRLRRLSSSPRRYQTESDDERIRVQVWSGEPSRRKERYVSEEYEARERTRSRSRSRERRYRNGIWCDKEDERETEAERWVRWRKVKKTKADEWRPLAGWRRA